MPELPAGTVTFLFTDVEGSTRLLHELGAERYADVLAEHRRVIREACARYGGVEVDTQGDSFFVAFASAPAALEAVRQAVGELESGRVRVRAGVHTGTPVVTDQGYVGGDVHRAARIAAAGHGGQVLVSSSTAALVADAEIVDLGEHRFKDLAAPERVYQLGTGSFPPLRSLSRTNLPLPATPFLGRGRELADVVELLTGAEPRLLTLTGPGGTGKTRLALQAAAEASEPYVDGIWWVPLSSLHEAHLVVPALAQALGVEEQPGRELVDVLTDRLTGRRMLLLLDNVEHLLPEIADEIEALHRIAGSKLLLTSRERLQLPGEHVYPVPTLAEEEGAELFLARARALHPDVRKSSAVAELCLRLDNLPLALELAAARSVVFSPEQLLERLSQRLDLLKAGRGADPRQRTLRATIEWSYDLLDDEEQTLLRALSVFAGGASYEGAEVLCGADPDTLESLLDKSLLRRQDGPGASRYWMLETIREFAAEKLAVACETKALRRRHAEYFLAHARSANLYNEADGEQRHALVIPERHNMRTALEWALDTGERELGLELLVALEGFWGTNSPHEGADWAAALLDGDPDVSERLVERALRVWGGQENLIGRPDAAEEHWERALEIGRRIGDDLGVALVLHRLANAAVDLRGDLARAQALAEESLAIHRRVGFRKGESHVLTMPLAVIARAEGDLEGALELLQEARRIAEETRFRWWLSGVLARIAAVSLELGRVDDAARAAREALTLSRTMNDRKALVYEIALLAEISAAAGNRERAGTLWGAAEAENERTWVGRWLHGAVEPERVLAYSDAAFEDGRATGRGLSLDDAIAFALE